MILKATKNNNLLNLARQTFCTKATSTVTPTPTPTSTGVKDPSKDFKVNEDGDYIVTLFAGDGIGPEISESVVNIFKAAEVPIQWEQHEISSRAVNKDGDLISQGALDSIRRNKVALKGPFMTPIGGGFRSLNVTLRKKLQLYANVRPCRTIPGLKNLYANDNVDVVTIRENTEGEYAGLEHSVVPGVSESLKIISREACERVAKYAFEYARNNNRERVIAVHKAGVMKMADGLFLKVAREVRERYPEIDYDEKQVDTMCMRLAMDPSQVDVMLMPNLYGDIVSDLCAGLIGGLGLTPSGNIGKEAAVFEAVHGTAPDIAGRDMANPTALLFSAIMMLEHMDLHEQAARIKKSVYYTLENELENCTGDLGGRGSTTSYTDTIIKNLE